MITRFVEATDGVAYGKFLVCRLDDQDLATESAMPEAPAGTRLLTYAGRRRFNDHTTLVVDLQTGQARWRTSSASNTNVVRLTETRRLGFAHCTSRS